MMVISYPSKGELRCAGCSLIISQVLLSIATILHTVDFDVYNIEDEADMVLLHDTISSEAHKAEIEIAVTLIWISFPFLLIGLYGLKTSMIVWYQGTWMKMLIFMYEKAYILWMAVIMIIIPALSLVSVSFDWTLYVDNPNIGYFLQSYVVFFELELFDCANIADAVFILSLYLAAFILNYGAQTGNKRWSEYIRLISGVNNSTIQWCGLIMNGCCILVMAIIFLVILFEFAESGFYSPTGKAKSVLILVFLSKIYLGLWMILQTRSGAYEELKKLAENNDKSEHALTSDDKQNYQMEQINVDQVDTKP